MSFFTENEMNAAFVQKVNYLNRVYHNSAGPIADVDGIVVIIADTSGGGFKLDLPVDPSPRFAPIIINVGANILTVGAIINDFFNPTISIQWSALKVKHAGGTYYAGLEVIP